MIAPLIGAIIALSQPSPSAQAVSEVSRSEPRLSVAASRIAACESGERRQDGRAVPGTLDWSAQNPNSTASGAFQFLDSTWHYVTGRTDRAMDAPPEVQIAAFETLWANGAGASNWDASRSCWG